MSIKCLYIDKGIGAIDDALDYLGLPDGVETVDTLRSCPPELWE